MALHQVEQRGEVAVYYADEVRFSGQASVPYAWQQRGQSAEELPAESGATGGYCIRGFWQSADPQATGRQAFMARLSPSAFTAALFVAAVTEWLLDQLIPTVLVLNNASIHKAHLVQQQVLDWADQGLTKQDFIEVLVAMIKTKFTLLIAVDWRHRSKLCPIF